MFKYDDKSPKHKLNVMSFNFFNKLDFNLINYENKTQKVMVFVKN